MSSQTTDLWSRCAQIAVAVDGLVRLVRAEYPDSLTLAEIAETWGPGEGLTPDQVRAVAALDRS